MLVPVLIRRHFGRAGAEPRRREGTRLPQASRPETIRYRCIRLSRRTRRSCEGQAERVISVALRITESRSESGHIIVPDDLPAGFEIDDPRLVSFRDSDTLDRIRTAPVSVTPEFRGDRFRALLERKMTRSLRRPKSDARYLQGGMSCRKLMWRICTTHRVTAAPEPLTYRQ